ncbi:MAG TPA: low molecular weight phosphatase family protein [Candidatus Limnocylindria bacterium]|nr:low molecular weight phosphatase family protein [Candidatus Limnocylindria bacterium]
MKILFVCKGNNCRSQIAEAIYNRLTDSTDASSAGTRVEGAGDTLGDFGDRPGVKSFTLDVMRDAGFNIENNKQVQLTKDMLNKYDLVVNMAAKQFTPAWLSSAPNYIHWKVTDPRGRSYAVTASAKRMIEDKVRELVEV